MTPAERDIKVVRGNAGGTAGLIVRLKAPTGVGGALENIPFENVRLSVYKRNDMLFRITLDDATDTLVVSDVDEAEIRWQPTTEQTRLIPKGENKAQYELEVWQGGSETTYLMGGITGIGGINDDQSDGAGDSDTAGS